MSDWKSDYGVSDQGAWNAGVYGTPNSTYDIARAQAETAKLQAGYSASAPTPDYTSPTFPSYSPTAAGQAYYPTSSGGSTGCLKVLLVLGAIAAIVPLLPFLLLQAAVLWSAVSQEPAALQTSHYERMSSAATALSAQPTTRLYAQYLPAATADWNTLDARQREAVAAAWIRFTRDPASFRRLAAKDRQFVFATFDGYLRHLEAAGDGHAARDRKALDDFRR